MRWKMPVNYHNTIILSKTVGIRFQSHVHIGNVMLLSTNWQTRTRTHKHPRDDTMLFRTCTEKWSLKRTKRRSNDYRRLLLRRRRRRRRRRAQRAEKGRANITTRHRTRDWRETRPMRHRWSGNGSRAAALVGAKESPDSDWTGLTGAPPNSQTGIGPVTSRRAPLGSNVRGVVDGPLGFRHNVQFIIITSSRCRRRLPALVTALSR